MSKTQKDALNRAHAEFDEIRNRIESITRHDLMRGEHLSLGVSITNAFLELSKALKAGDRLK